MDEALERFLELIAPFTRIARAPGGGFLAAQDDYHAQQVASVFAPSVAFGPVIFRDARGRPVAATGPGWSAVASPFATAPAAHRDDDIDVFFAGEADEDALAIVAEIAAAWDAGEVVAPPRAERVFRVLSRRVSSDRWPDVALARLACVMCTARGVDPGLPRRARGPRYRDPVVGRIFFDGVGKGTTENREDAPPRAVAAAFDYLPSRDCTRAFVVEPADLGACVAALEANGAPPPPVGDSVGLSAIVERMRTGAIAEPWPRVWREATRAEVVEAMLEAAARRDFAEVREAGGRVWTVLTVAGSWAEGTWKAAIPGRAPGGPPIAVHHGWPEGFADLARDVHEHGAAVRPHRPRETVVVVPRSLEGQFAGFFADSLKATLDHGDPAGFMCAFATLNAAAWLAARREESGASVVYHLPVALGGLTRDCGTGVGLWPVRVIEAEEDADTA